MFSCSPCASITLPEEYRAIADELFPPEGKGPSVKAAEAFAGILGINEDYSHVQNAHLSGQPLRKFLYGFQNNLDLLIQKTWVEKSEEIRKEKLQDQVLPLVALIEKGDYPGALEEFGAILEELAYLFFGAQSQKDDFIEYALRIDTQMGIFWWYGEQINGITKTPWVKNADQAVLQALLFLGICYLTNF